MLLDTNVISEMWRARPDVRVTTWLNAKNFDQLFICTPVLAEIRSGIERLDAGPRRQYLERMAGDLIETVYRNRILDFDIDAALIFGRISAQRQRSGRRIELLDGMIAATALANRMPLVTRNVHDFSDIGLDVIDPFSADPS